MITNINLIHGKSLTSKIFRKVYAAFALNQKNFFGSSDVQLLRIGTVLKGGVLLSTASSNHEHIFNIFSVSIVPEMGQDFLEAFGSVVTQEDYEISREDCGLIFEIKLVASQFWQIKIRILLNSTSKNKLEELILGKHLVVKERSFVEKIDTNDKGRSPKKKTVKKGDIVHTGRGGSTPVPFLSPNLPDSQITQKWTFDTTI